MQRTRRGRKAAVGILISRKHLFLPAFTDWQKVFTICSYFFQKPIDNERNRVYNMFKPTELAKKRER